MRRLPATQGVLSFALPPCDWRPPSLASLPSWADAKRVSIDVETCDPDLDDLGPGTRRGGYMVGVAFAIEDGPAHYLPFAHEGGDNLDREQVLAYLRDQAKVFRGHVCGGNLEYDLDYLWAADVRHDACAGYKDMQLAEPLIDDLQHRYSVQAISERRQMPGKDEVVLRAAAKAYGVHPKKDLWRLPARFVGQYGVQDVRIPLTCLRKQERDIEEQELERVWQLESEVLPVLVRMRARGVEVDLDRVQKIDRWALQVEQEELNKIHQMTGVRLGIGDVNKAAALEPCFTYIGVQLPRTPNTNKPSITKGLLGSIDHDVARAIRRAREFSKLRTTFCQSIYTHQVNGRIHPTFNQLRKTKDESESTTEDEGEEGEGARFGRVSCVDPNLQQQPIRNKEYGKIWRSIYRCDFGSDGWVSGDFSQQEPHIIVHYASLLNLEGAREFEHRYVTDPIGTDFHTMTAKISGLARPDAKNLGLGLAYGMGGGKLCRSLGLPTVWTVNREGRSVEVAGPEGQAKMDQFDAGVPFIKQLARRCQQEVKRKGHVITIGGRHCRFPRDASGNYDWLHKALNRLIQGSAADQTKAALVVADREGIPIQLQVHDEITFSHRGMAQVRLLKKVMEETTPIRSKNRAEMKVGPSYGEVVELTEEQLAA